MAGACPLMGTVLLAVCLAACASHGAPAARAGNTAQMAEIRYLLKQLEAGEPEHDRHELAARLTARVGALSKERMAAIGPQDRARLTQRLTALLSDEDIVFDISMALAELGTKAKMDGLLTALESKGPGLDRPGLVGLLAALLTGLSEEEIAAMGPQDRAQVVQRLMGLLDREDIVVEIAHTLGRLGKHAEPALPKMLRVLHEAEQDVISQIRKGGSAPAMEPGVIRLEGESTDVIRILRGSIRNIDPRAVPSCPEDLPELFCDVDAWRALQFG